MRGWKPDGTEITLLPWQEEMARKFMEFYDTGIYWHIMPAAGRGYGKSVLTATLSRLRKNKEETGEWLPGELGQGKESLLRPG